METATEGAVTLGEGQINLSAKLRECQPDRDALQALLEPMFKALWHDALQCLEQALPDHAEPGSGDGRVFRMLRGRILTAGNQQTRELPKVLNCFMVKQVYKREQVVKLVVPYSLPQGVRMPAEKRTEE